MWFNRFNKRTKSAVRLVWKVQEAGRKVDVGPTEHCLVAQTDISSGNFRRTFYSFLPGIFKREYSEAIFNEFNPTNPSSQELLGCVCDQFFFHWYESFLSAALFLIEDIFLCKHRTVGTRVPAVYVGVFLTIRSAFMHYLVAITLPNVFNRWTYRVQLCIYSFIRTYLLIVSISSPRACCRNLKAARTYQLRW